MPIDVNIPWAQTQHWYDESVSRDLNTGFQMAQQIEQRRERNDYMRSQLALTFLQRTSQLKQAELREQRARDELSDSALISDWMKNPNNPPPDGIRTPRGLQIIAQQQSASARIERNSIFGAVQKGYNDKLKTLDATGLLKVQQLLNVNQGEITPEIAQVIDAETTRMQGTMADIQVLDEMGEPFVKGGENKPAFLRSTKTGALHKLPQDWTENNPVVPLKDDEGNILGYGVRNSSGGITQLRQQKADEPTLTAPQKAAMNSEFKTINQWWSDLDIKQRAKPENQADLQRRLKAVQDKYSTSPATPSANSSVRMRVRAPDGKIGTIPENQLQEALKQGYSTVE